MREESANAPDLEVAAIAGRQHGVITVWQLAEAGVGRSGVSRRVGAGRLHRLHQGVYAVGHARPSNEGRWLAAVLACGQGAVLSHRSAAALWRMLPARKEPAHVTIPTAAGRKRRSGIHIHRSPSLQKDATTSRKRIAVTTPARTLADLRRTIPADQLRRAIRQAEFLGLDLGEAPTDHTRSELERAFLRLCRRYRIPMPEVNVPIGPYTVDFLWREQRLIVETDGYASHRGIQAFRDDRARENDLMTWGFDVIRFADHRIGAEPEAVAAVVRARLSDPRP